MRPTQPRLGHEQAISGLGPWRWFVDAAVTAGVRPIVYLSFVGASATSGFILGRDHGATEDHIRASGLEWTFVRDNFYAEILPMFADDEGVIRGPAGSGRASTWAVRTDSSMRPSTKHEPAAPAVPTRDIVRRGDRRELLSTL